MGSAKKSDSETINEARQAILNSLACIPHGRVSTYGVIAKIAGQTGKARLVGHILKKLPHSSNIPWHRVINSQGKSSFPANSEQYLCQMSKLENEGVQLNAGKVSLKDYLWQGE